MSNENKKENGFSVKSHCVGYVKKVTNPPDKDFMKIDVSILSGKKEAIKYLHSSFFVNGEIAKKIVSDIPVIDEGVKVLISFIADLRPDAFLGSENKVVPFFSGSLYLVKSVKINDQFIYQLPSNSNAE